MNGAGGWTAVLLAIIGGIAGIAALIRTFLERPRIRAEAMKTINDTALSTMKEIDATALAARQEAAEARRELRDAEDRIDELEENEGRHIRAIRLLAGYVIENHRVLEQAGLVPPPMPLSRDEIESLLELRSTRSERGE